MKITPIKIAILVGIISAVIAFVTTNGSNEFFDTIRGVAYEGFVFSCVLAIMLSLYETAKEKSEKEALLREKRKSRDSLIKLISLLSEAYHLGGAFHWTKHVKYADTFENNFIAFQKAKAERKDELSTQLKDKFFKNSCEQNLPIFTAHIPIAATLSPRHLDAWIGLTTVISLTASEDLDPKMILDEFEEFVTDFTTAKIEIV